MEIISMNNCNLIHIMDGYSFRHMLGIIKTETDTATMILSLDTIEISFSNLSQCALHKIVLNTKEFSMYRYNTRKANGELEESYPIAFDTNELYNTTKGIGKKDGLRIYWVQGDHKINVQQIKMGTKDPGRVGAIFARILTIEHKRYDIEAYPTEPNMRVQAKDFADLCNLAGTTKSSCLEITGHKNSVTFKGIRSNLSVAFLNNFKQTLHNVGGLISTDFTPNNNINDENNLYVDGLLEAARNIDSSYNTSKKINIINKDEILKVKLPMSTVKSLSKICNISQPGTLLRFYFVEKQPIKIESPIGIYGTYIICVRDV